MATDNRKYRAQRSALLSLSPNLNCSGQWRGVGSAAGSQRNGPAHPGHSAARSTRRYPGPRSNPPEPYWLGGNHSPVRWQRKSPSGRTTASNRFRHPQPRSRTFLHLTAASDRLRSIVDPPGRRSCAQMATQPDRSTDASNSGESFFVALSAISLPKGGAEFGA
jgi:hypothetical protein